MILAIILLVLGISAVVIAMATALVSYNEKTDELRPVIMTRVLLSGAIMILAGVVLIIIRMI